MSKVTFAGNCLFRLGQAGLVLLSLITLVLGAVGCFTVDQSAPNPDRSACVIVSEQCVAVPDGR